MRSGEVGMGLMGWMGGDPDPRTYSYTPVNSTTFTSYCLHSDLNFWVSSDIFSLFIKCHECIVLVVFFVATCTQN